LATAFRALAATEPSISDKRAPGGQK